MSLRISTGDWRGLVLGLLLWHGVFALAQQPPSDAGHAPAAHARTLQFLDLDGDGRIDVRELAAGQQAAAMILLLEWNECDSDRDGTLSTAEFERAAARTMQALLAPRTDDENLEETRARDDLAAAVPLRLILERVARSPRYADEFAALRKSVDDLDDEEEVVAWVFARPTVCPRLGLLLRTWIRSYPVSPGLWRYVTPANPPPAASPEKSAAGRNGASPGLKGTPPPDEKHPAPSALSPSHAHTPDVQSAPTP